MTSMIPCEIVTGIGFVAMIVVAFCSIVRECCMACCEEEENTPAPTPLITVEDDKIEETKRQLYMK